MEHSIYAPKAQQAPQAQQSLTSNSIVKDSLHKYASKATFKVAEPFKPSLYFFYSTLATPENLKRALGLKSFPEMRRAEVSGYSIGTWGIYYAALFQAAPSEKVLGFVYEMGTPEEVESLAVHLTNAYEIIPCRITLKDTLQPQVVMGKTFVYAGDAKALQEERFDRKLWERVGSMAYNEIRNSGLGPGSNENGRQLNSNPYPFKFVSSSPVIIRNPSSFQAPAREPPPLTQYLESLRGTMAMEMDTSPDIAALGVRDTNMDPYQKTSKWKGDRSLSESEEKRTLPELQSSWMPPEMVERDEEFQILMDGTFKSCELVSSVLSDGKCSDLLLESRWSRR
ncbi:MAG: hypothetical protein M1829_004061 [Trizodia sp. TS-e1964]|nr:MAG: hypothetical protein M1829_004061 [Trizodia sp. TS-e1964]